MELNKNSLCYTCLGCNKLEIEQFRGTNKCENYVRGETNDNQKIMFSKL